MRLFSPRPVIALLLATSFALATFAQTRGFDPANMCTTTCKACDDFYQYANGTWAKDTPIPADKSNYGMFTKLDDLSKERTRTIIDEQAKDPSNKIGNAYNAFLDTAAIEAKHATPKEGVAE